MRYISLFSGIGGFELGMQRAFERCQSARPRQGQTGQRAKGQNCQCPDPSTDRPTCVGFSEIDKHALQIYDKHFPCHANLGDITSINADALPRFDLLVGGFPCQAFSLAGKRGGFSDTRGALFFEIARILKHHRPRLFLLENVKGLLSHDGGATFTTIIRTLVELGYDLQWQVLNSKDFGVPQNRERVFIVGHLGGTSRQQVFHVGEKDGQAALADQDELSPPNLARCLTATDFKLHSDGQYVRHSYRMDVRTGADLCSNSTGNLRRFTPLECERLQGFPDGWTEGVSDTQRYRCLGNAATVPVIAAIAERLLRLR